MKRGSWVRYFWGAVASVFLASGAYAYDEPVVNLGYTSFLDGGPPAGPGLYFQDYLQFYSSNRFMDAQGNRLPLPRTDLDVAANVTQLVYVSKIRLGNASLGFSALMPWLLQARVDDGLNNLILQSRTGNGDLFFGPAIQFDPLMRADGQGPRFVHRLALDIAAPVGQYDPLKAVNPGSNFWSLNPHWAATWWVTPRWSVSARLHYLWNAKNTRPNVAFGPMTISTQAGEAVFGNIAAEYGFTEQFHAGVNGYFFDQYADTRVNGVSVPGRKEKVWAIGPGALYGFTKEQFLLLNVYFEQDVKNRPQGTNVVLRYVVHFG